MWGPVTVWLPVYFFGHFCLRSLQRMCYHPTHILLYLLSYRLCRSSMLCQLNVDEYSKTVFFLVSLSAKDLILELNVRHKMDIFCRQHCHKQIFTGLPCLTSQVHINLGHLIQIYNSTSCTRTVSHCIPLCEQMVIGETEFDRDMGKEPVPDDRHLNSVLNYHIAPLYKTK